MLEFPGRHTFGVGIGNLFEFQGAFRGDGEVDSSGYVVEITLVFQLLAEVERLILVPVQNPGYLAVQAGKLSCRFIKSVNHRERQQVEYGQLRQEGLGGGYGYLGTTVQVDDLLAQVSQYRIRPVDYGDDLRSVVSGRLHPLDYIGGLAPLGNNSDHGFF